MAEKGHEEPFLPLKLSGRCGSRKRSLAAMVSRRQVNEPNTRLFGNSILRCLAHPAVQQDAASDCAFLRDLRVRAFIFGGTLSSNPVRSSAESDFHVGVFAASG